MKGVDYAWGYNPAVPTAVKNAGYGFVCRYLSHDPSKDATPTELAALHAAGLPTVLVWELAANRMEAGQVAGHADAAEAYARARTLGHDVVFFACDYDTTVGPNIRGYFAGVREVQPDVSRIGVYGGYRVVKAALDEGLAGLGWQTCAWSGGLWDPRAVLRQYAAQPTLAGVQCDLNEAFGPYFGQTPRPLPPPVPVPSEEDEMRVIIPQQGPWYLLYPSGVLVAIPAGQDGGAFGPVVKVTDAMFEALAAESNRVQGK